MATPEERIASVRAEVAKVMGVPEDQLTATYDEKTGEVRVTHIEGPFE